MLADNILLWTLGTSQAALRSDVASTARGAAARALGSGRWGHCQGSKRPPKCKDPNMGIAISKPFQRLQASHMQSQS